VGPLVLIFLITLCVLLVTRMIVRGSVAYRLPCVALGIWSAAMLVVPVGALAVLAVVLWDQHTWQRASLLPMGGAVAASVALLVATLVVGRRLWRINGAARQRRRRHKMLIDLFAARRRDLGNVDVIPDARLFAYSVPCVVSGRIVISQGVVDQLDPAPLQAVLAHERAHLIARHHLVLQLATAVAESFPRSAWAAALPQRITPAVEMAADCYARRRVGQRATITALTALADMAVPAGGLPAGGRAVPLRLAHLRSRAVCCQTTKGRSAHTLAVAVLAMPVAIGAMNRIVDLCPWG
jgi:Zn-dependent protease with chaperone function